MLLPGFVLTVLFSPVVDMQSLLALPDCLCILPVLFRHEILPDTCPSKHPSCDAVRCGMWVTGRRDTCVFKVSPCPVPTG